MGNCLIKEKRHRDAIRCYDQVIRLEPHHHEVWEMKILCLRELGMEDQANQLEDKRKMDEW